MYCRHLQYGKNTGNLESMSLDHLYNHLVGFVIHRSCVVQINTSYLNTCAMSPADNNSVGHVPTVLPVHCRVQKISITKRDGHIHIQVQKNEMLNTIILLSVVLLFHILI